MLKLRELYYITHIENLLSILKRGILCHRKIIEEQINFTPIYDEDIIALRKGKRVPDGRELWDFVNLYFQPRNPMLYRVLFHSNFKIDEVVVIGLKNSLLNRNDIILTDGNAASSNTQFFPVKDRDISKYIREKTDKEWWAIEDGSKREIMAECLVPEKVEPEYISEIYVANQDAMNRVRDICDERITVIPEPELFFLP